MSRCPVSFRSRPPCPNFDPRKRRQSTCGSRCSSGFAPYQHLAVVSGNGLRAMEGAQGDRCRPFLACYCPSSVQEKPSYRTPTSSLLYRALGWIRHRAREESRCIFQACHVREIASCAWRLKINSPSLVPDTGRFSRSRLSDGPSTMLLRHR